jgi:pyrrolysine biosynthesis protein PylC
MVELLVRIFNDDNTWYVELENVKNMSTRHVVYEHIRVKREMLCTTGERAIADADSLRLEHGLWGADEIMTNYTPERNEWVATLIIADVSGETVRNRRQKVIETIRKECRIEKIIDEGS